MEPRKDSDLYKRLYEARKEALSLFGSDESYLYGLHSSVTCFFTTSYEEAQAVLFDLDWAFLSSLEAAKDKGMGLDEGLSLSALCSGGSSSTVSSIYTSADEQQSPSSLASMVTAASSGCSVSPVKVVGVDGSQEKEADTSSFETSAAAVAPVEVEELLLSPDGCVLLSVSYDKVLYEVRSVLSGCIRDGIRYKKRAHLTLAKDRMGEEGTKLLNFYREKLGRPVSEFGPITAWDLVVYERTFRSESLQEDGPHVLNELVRFPLQ
ncbi:hypothetical protein Pmar_PMAR005768 [Perkinsus marinus ATCC 50983]|uniref:Uncharacterized protein n=1 Tax=Perkinsus marinus (strain ATCC 50983 / TXsc) TaxID=423536 RepID=C5KE34_PERM5|nr:hypothetical protein Pmar_PMAR005768 [Perkinsus marinus ATCC 50983]EER17246.1 hypothetical protein Pmar_PMAR005768 [Perkinsus marinus ATCC 50983]|eukprot:XP_002785450.1 hypothetical protein Pmar_PMAR005768 [Perkinsus marinus ATCC 50983]